MGTDWQDVDALTLDAELVDDRKSYHNLPAGVVEAGCVLDQAREKARIVRDDVLLAPARGRTKRSDARAMQTGGALEVGDRVTLVLIQDPHARFMGREELHIIVSDGDWQTLFYWDRHAGLSFRTEHADDVDLATEARRRSGAEVFDVVIKRLKPVNVWLTGSPSLARHLLGIYYPWWFVFLPWKWTARGTYREALDRLRKKGKEPSGLFMTILRQFVAPE